ncbi:MAG: hypothetical protein IT384_14370 [Deltaproteobacteria bacterium]|nr:hypothetical protein [Deltaproteobacteria bacterium]
MRRFDACLVTGSRRLAVIALLVAGTAACADRGERRYAPWPEIDLAVAFLVLELDEAVGRSIGPLALSAGELVHGPSVVESAAGEADGAVLVGFSTEALASVLPTFAADRLDEAVLEPGVETCQPERLDEPSLLAYARIDGRATVMQLGADGAWTSTGAHQRRWVDHHRIALPFDPALCLASKSPPTVRPFGDQAELLRAGTMVGGQAIRTLAVQDVELLDADKVVSYVDGFFLLFERGAPFVGDDRHGIALRSVLPAVPEGTWVVTGLSVDRSPAAPAHEWRVLASAAAQRGARWIAGAVLEIEIDAGGIRSTRTATGPISEGLSAVVVDPSGRIVVVGEHGLVLTATSSRGDWSAFRLDDSTGQLNRVAFTGDPARPHFVGTLAGLVLLGDAGRGAASFVREHLEPGNQSSTVVTAVSLHEVSAGRAELYAATYSDGLFRRSPEGEWSRVALEVAPEARGCGGAPTDCGRRTYSEAPEDLTLTARGTIVFMPEFCTAIFEHDRRGGCGRPIPLQPGTIQNTPSTQPRERFNALGSLGDRIVISGTRGRVLEVELP